MIQPHCGPGDANFLLSVLLKELEKRQHGRDSGLDADFLDLAGCFHADRRTDCGVQHVVEVDQSVVDSKTAVVRQVRVVHSRPQERGHGVLFLPRHVENRLSEDGIRLWVDADQAKRHLRDFFVVH